MVLNSSLLYVLDSHSRHLIRRTPTPTKLSLIKLVGKGGGGGDLPPCNRWESNEPLASREFTKLGVLPSCCCWCLFFLSFFSSADEEEEWAWGSSSLGVGSFTSCRFVRRWLRSSWASCCWLPSKAGNSLTMERNRSVGNTGSLKYKIQILKYERSKI